MKNALKNYKKNPFMNRWLNNQNQINETISETIVRMRRDVSSLGVGGGGGSGSTNPASPQFSFNQCVCPPEYLIDNLLRITQKN
ncbi:hypothetical protein QR98_0087150 [Sarcoptes scabiei]|uniref:Uncharacterized protein n=1 Tax=Sarcoptes scabiei TaxID=52283 RepID=A0A132AHX6_SARSC|nr:hypothetical protein QR98_0087150 [Sarcoptes scabiei]